MKEGDDLKSVQWPLLGYAPGGYVGVCTECGSNMINVDKRARHCLGCAISLSQKINREHQRKVN